MFKQEFFNTSSSTEHKTDLAVSCGALGAHTVQEADVAPILNAGWKECFPEEAGLID